MNKIFLLSIIIFLNVNAVLAQKHLYVSADNGINLREGPGTNHKTLTSIPKGAKLEIVSENGEWVKVKHEGKTGYVSRQYLSENKPRTAENKTSGNNDKGGTSSKAKSKGNSSGSNSKNSGATGTSDLPSWAVGLRMGDPFGLSAKKYLSRGHALEFNIGSTSYWGYDYRGDFYDRERYRNYDYLGHRRSGAIAVQVHYLFQKSFPSVPNLHWYWGVGGQFRSKTYRYNYRYRNYFPGSNDYVWVYANDRVSDLDFGADVAIGMEYHLPKAPISFFADSNILMELFDDPFSFYLQGGIGVRFNIR